MALGRTGEAVKEIEKIRTGDTGVPELPWNSELVDLFMIRSFLETGEWRAAAASCRTWLRFRGEKSLIHAFYAEALRNMNNYEAAHNHLQRAIEKEPGELEFWYADILVSWEGKDYGSLKKAIRAVDALGGDREMVRRFSILYQARTSDDTKSNITVLQNGIRSLGPEPELMYSLGEEYLKAGLIGEARNWFKKTITLKNNHERAWLGEITALEALLDSAGDSQYKRQQTSELASLYKTYLEKWPDNSSIRREWALFLIGIFDYAAAALELEKLLAFEPSNPSLRRVLAYTYRKTGRYREAAVFLKALLREKPRDLGLLLEYSGCLERAGAGEYAVAVLEKARELFQSFPQKKKFPGPGKNAPDSKGIFGNLNVPGNHEASEISLALGILYYRQKKVEKAFDFLREAAAINSGDPRPYEWMAIISRKKGDEAGARSYDREAENRKKTQIKP
jgi:tetratricopeptide (TPR) repeat protein